MSKDEFNKNIDNNHEFTNFANMIEAHTQSYIKNLLINKQGCTNLFNHVLEPGIKSILYTVMNHVEGNQSRAARILGISRGTLRQYLIKYFGTLKIN